MNLYMLDTNTVSHLLKGNSSVARHVVGVPMASLCISSITEGELLYGLAKRPDATRLQQAVRELLRRVDVLAWDRATAQRYGVIRAEMERRGKVLGSLDLLIAAHAMATGRVLVTNDRAFRQVEGLPLEDWAA